ncbi:hypothetical protein B5X24_HaOG214333 [Helicoverpa armigera]|nr:hypothetical protein B5X24_HaOG214333 [Helicoverpa armigera]
MENFTGSMDDPVAQRWNSSSIDFADLTIDRNFALLLVSLISAILWIVYITYYNSRVLGYILTRLINKFYFQDDNFKIGSFTLNALSGKIMFRDIVYINYDYSLRIQDGYLIFRWWRSYVPKDVSEDLSHSDTRLSIMLNGFELHFYNRCDLYNELEKIFGLEPVIKQQNDDDYTDRDKAMNDANEKRRRAQETVRSEAAMARTWRDLIPVIKIDICSGRVVFGNRLVPTTLSISVEESHLVYSTKPPASSLDHLMHFVKAKAENCKVMLAPSPNYTSMVDEPPRYMGEGFVVMSSNYIEVYFYMDEPGLVPEQPVLLQLANGDIVESAPPIWGVDIKCGKGTDFSYGPWADRQRDHLFKFFFPPNYKNLEVTPQPKPGDIRQTQSFDIRLSTLNEATIDILFTKNKETNAVHINIGAGSYLEVTLPWIVLQDGYTTKITGQLLHLEATTSLQYRSLAESETLEYTVKCHYPLVWNHHQCWQLSLTGCKATTHLVYTHIDFFQDLINDWSTKARPDILHFVPYTWKISLLLKECEVVTVSNQYNWIDCSSTNQENNHVAFCGDLLDVSFDLPFVDFLPDFIPLKIWVQGEAVDMSLYLPEVNTSKLLLLSLDKNMKLVPCRLKASKWRRKCVKSQGWVDCWSVPIVALSVRYNYHPIPPLGPEPQADITTPEKEEILLSPMRIPRMRKQPQINWTLDGNKFDRTTLPPDKVSVELEVGPSILLAYGTIITSFMNLLENIFGEDQTFTDMQKTPNMETFYWSSDNTKLNDKSSVNQHTEISIDDSTDSSKGPFDPRHYRPLDVTVSIIIHDIQAHLVKNCSESEPPCPVILIERFGFEMDKSFRETKLQLLLSPSILVSANNLSRSNPTNSGALYQGHLMLSSFQLRGNGFFSDTNRTVEEDTVEYAWMMELQLGQLTGRLTLPQLYQIISSLETFLLLICDSENELVPPNPARQCHHGLNNVMCAETDLTLKYRCPTANEIKYKMIRVAIDLIDIYIADSNTTLQTWISPVRLSFCNLHGSGFGTGVTGLLPNIKLALYTQTNMQANTHHHSNGSNNSQNKPPESDNWVGVGSVALGPLLIEAASSLPQTPKNLHLVQQKFLKLHDDKTKRLWFLWPVEGKSSQCGCTGGCAFFGSNRNGPNFLKPNPNDLNEGINVAMFNIIETTPGEYGYGQSLLHQGQLVFHTPPYNSLNVCLQPTNVATLIPSPLPQNLNKSPQSAERRSLTRRFSYTSMSKGSNNLLVSSTKSDVPYARLVDSSVPLGSTKIDSDSKLNKSILNVPQMESSVSDSKLALSCGAKDNANVTGKKPAPSETESFVVPKVPVRSVAVSESHYSLNSQVPPEDTLPAEVQRTMSITSENHSEAFFSADEDMFPSRSSSLKHSFGSRHSNPRDKSSFGINDITNEKWTSSAPKSEAVDIPDTISNLSTGVQPDSESGSVSSTSFISAISSQEDMTLVNLHMQTNKPIVDSPLLMASYMHNLPQYKCPNWTCCSLPSGSDVFTLPLFKRADDGTLVYVGQKYLPSFEPVGKINILRLVSKKDHNNQNQHGPYSNLPPHFNSQVKAHPYPQGWWDVQQTVQDSQENTTEKSTASTVTTTSDSKSGLFIKLRGEIDIMLTPLVLESTQKFVESLTPVLANIHPITNWLPQMQDRSQSNLVTDKDDKCKLATIPHSNVYEESICESLQATVTIPKVNMIFIQSSVVEDMISFSALDNIQDLTCVSLFGVSVENIIAKYVSTRKNLESVQLYYRPTLRALGSKKSFGIMKGPRALISAQTSGKRRGPERGEPVYIEASQQQCEDTTITLNVGKVHGQLRRIRNESSQLKDVTITGIPCQHSKVSFKFIRVDSCAKGCESMCCQNGTATEAQKDTPIGFIMFECGLEGISIKVSKHSQSHKPQTQTEEKKPLRPDNESCRESVKSAEETKPEKDRSTKSRTSGIEDLFRKRDSSSKPSTPNLGSAQPPPVPPPPEPSTPGPEEPSNNDSTTTVVPLKDNGNTSSCAIDLKVVWFNFAAPPRTPITKKIDYTRLDWNLLSTASPAINAWMNPCNRLGIRVVALYRAYARRLTATAASLMAAALDLAPHHTLPKSRYGRHTPMAKQLREEPSLQLCAVLLRYALQADAAAVQADLAERHLPSLSTLRQLCAVLLRYALQADAAAVQADLAERHLPSLSTLRQGVIVLSRQWKNILYTPLLLEHNYKSKVMKPLNVTFALPDLLEDSVEGWQEYPLETEALDENCLLLNMDVDKVNLPASGAAASPRPHSFPSTPPSDLDRAVRAAMEDVAKKLYKLKVSPKVDFSTPTSVDYGTLKEDLPTVGSNPSLYSPHGSDENIKNDRAREDLYQWMAKQEPIKVEAKSKKPIIPPSKMNPRAVAAAMPACSLYPLQGSLMLLDAHLVFQPFLAALGVSPHQVTQGSQTHATIPSETPAFLCEKVSIDVDLKKVADMAVDDLIQRQNVLYISRGQLKKHISTMLNFNISIRFISQQVNMPLLRLLHQISNMYQNVKDTQIELRTQTKISHRQNKHTSENLVSVTSLEKEVQYATLEPKWDIMAPTLTPELGLSVPQSLSQQKLSQPTRPRPQSFAQKLRSTGKSVKGKLGYSSLNEGAHTPMYAAGVGAGAGRGAGPHVTAGTPPGPGPHASLGSPVGPGPHASLSSPSADAADGKLAPRCWRTVYLLLDLYANMPDAETITHRFSVTTDIPEHYRHSRPARPSSREQNTSNSSSSAANMGMVVVGVARIHRTRLLASLSGLKLEAEITSLQASLSASRSRQWSLSGNLGRTMIVLLEGLAPNHQTVVRVSVGKSQALYGWEAGRQGATALLSVGGVRVDLPQHPVALHGVMTRSSRQLSSTLQELGVTRTSSRLSRAGPGGPAGGAGGSGSSSEGSPAPAPRPPRPPRPPPAHALLNPLHLHFSILLQSLSITAALLPSLQAQYKMEQVQSSGVTGNKAQFTVELQQHSLSFVTKLQVSEANIPASAAVWLPGVHVAGRVLEQRGAARREGALLRAGRYVAASADIGLFEHTLSTDLLNHLVFVQKVFMKEVNEVVQKVYGGEKPVPLWNEEEASTSALSRILFSLTIRIKRIQLTATTPSNSAVRLETGAVEFEISNRVQNVQQPTEPHEVRLFARAQVDVNLSLGQLIRNAMFEEAEPEFQQYAFFNTRISMRNAFQDEMVCGDDKEVVLITLKRPLIYIQPVAVDKAILVWLNYKNAYEYWNEKRLNLNKEVLTATQQVFEKVQLTSQITTPHLSTLFLQLNVDDIGICLPLNQPPMEVNEVVQKVYGGEKPVPLWNEEEASTSALSRILFSLTIRIKRIQLTATTPSNSAVRLETGAVEFEISNRVQNVQQPTEPHEVRLFARAQVDVNLSLGQLIRNAMFEEAEPEFQQYAFFNTRISMRNAFQDEMVCGDDKEVVLITLKRPLIYIQPVAVDKAILVWLNYKNAYEYWNEKRLNLNKEVLTATQQVFEKVQLTSQITTPHLSTLFLQLNVDDIGICLPLNQPPMARWGLGRGAWGAWCGEGEARGAVVVTLDATNIGACSSGALVSKGRFVGLCLRFADDFEASLDDWKPRPDEPSLNVCCVSEGTYEVCSRTTAAKHNENAKWFLNVSWQMEGVDIHLDVNVGKQLSALGHTLTMLTGYEEEDPLKMDYESDLDDEADNSKDSQESIILRRKYTDHLPAFVFDTSIDAKKRSKLIEKEMNEQAKIINDLRTLGASHTTIEYEMKRLHDLEALVFKDFRRDMIQKLRRQSVRASSITKGKLGLGSNRSKSFVVPSPPQERKDFEGAGEPNLAMSPGVGDSGETLLLGDEDNRLADIIEGGSWSSMESEPLTGPSRSASLRGPRPGTGGSRPLATPSVQRQSSLPAHPDHWPDELEGVELRRKHEHSVPQSEGPGSENKTNKAKTAEPNIDFELDVKVYINSGKCVLHTKEPSKEDDSIKIGRMRVGRSASGGLAEGSGAGGSPTAARRKQPHPRHQPTLDLTVFRVPGLDLKVHYESKTLPEEATSPQTVPPLPSLNVGARKVGVKKAALFAWITLQSIPEETIISPHILEFLEQTLEPIPTKASFSTPTPEAESGSRSRSVEGASYGQYVYASFPVDVIVHFHMQPSTFRFSCLPASRVECLLQLPSLQIVFSSKRASDEEMAEPAVAMGGLSVTGCLADFSVNMFHPYGGKKSSLKEAQWSPLSDTERKDSLSINVEFVKFHLSRSRKLDFQTDQDQSKATVRFSTIVDVGSAWFKYDMRRLGEILAFPKAWYRRTIVRRMFLGDLSLHDTRDHGTSSNAPVSPVLPQREKTKTVDHQKPKESKAAAPAMGAAWETLVLFAVNFTKLNVHMNMGNVMGNVSWQSRDFNCSGRLSIGSTGHRNMLLGVALAGSELDARGGIVGGAIALSSIDTYVHIEEEAGCNPGHVCGVRLAALELRLEYMGTPVLMARVSRLQAALRDEWLARCRQPPHHPHRPTSRPAIILTHGTLSWHQLQILMSRSTTPDLLKMQLKLEEFFTQQFKSSKRVFSSLHPNYTNSRRDRREPPPAAAAAAGEAGSAPAPELRHHRHWQEVLYLVSGMQLSTLPTPLPANGTVLGGTMELHGSNISLACFHGNSFKSKSWALFSLKDPCISFATEAQQVASEEGSMEVHVVQSLTASLGSTGSGARAHVSQATVCRMTRALLFPPQFKTLREWFHYAFANSEIDAIELFPSLERETNTSSSGAGSTNSTERKAGAADKHVREVIFALPSLQLHLRTHHLQAHAPPTDTDEKPVVECSFITEFEDHIFVSVDAEAFLFLHDLISSYIKEKDRVMPGASRAGWAESGGASTSASRAGAAPRPEGVAQDYRDYRCVTWHLEPTVRLLSWAGKSIEPYGVDYILQKLGFSHARTTIPKWLQRGTLDPLDKLLSLVLLRLVAIVPHK